MDIVVRTGREKVGRGGGLVMEVDDEKRRLEYVRYDDERKSDRPMAVVAAAMAVVCTVV